MRRAGRGREHTVTVPLTFSFPRDVASCLWSSVTSRKDAVASKGALSVCVKKAIIPHKLQKELSLTYSTAGSVEK